MASAVARWSRPLGDLVGVNCRDKMEHASGSLKGAGQFSGALGPTSPSFSARVLMPSLNSVGNVSSERPGVPSARSPS